MTDKGPNRILDDLAKLMTDAAGAAQGARQEAEGVLRTQIERVLNKLDVVQREDFEAVKEMAVKARTENEALSRRIEALELQVKAAEKSAGEK